jgi:hypothetical protein
MRTALAWVLLLAVGARAQDAGLASLAEPDPVSLGARAGEPSAGAGSGEPDLTVFGVSLSVSGFAQVDVMPYAQASIDELDPSTRTPLNETALVLRRAHLALAARKWLFSTQAEVEATSVGGFGVRLYSAEVAARWPLEGDVPLVQLSLGLLVIPFGREVQQGALRRAFLERATWARALFPGSHDLGVMLSGGWRFVRYQLAVMNGEPGGTTAFPGQDPNAAKDVVGRLGAVVAPASWLRMEAGASGLWGTGFHPGAPGTKDTLVWRDANEDGQVQLTELQVVGGLPATASQNFERFAVGADLHLTVEVPRLGDLDLVGEVAWGKNLDRGLFVADPVGLGRDVRELGWTVSLLQQLPWGFGLGGRLDVYRPDADASDPQGARLVPVDPSLTTWAVLASWHWERTVRVRTEYQHQTNALGRGLGGAPTTLGADTLTVRAEVAF